MKSIIPTKKREPIIYICEACHATTDKPIWARSFAGGRICPDCERYYDTLLDSPAQEIGAKS